MLNTNNELEDIKKQLIEKTELLSKSEAQLEHYIGLDDRLRILANEKTELETQIAGQQNKLSAAVTRYLIVY